tara:strand:- start:168 stop:452 length:285 start_codon:yes stop_codon:yes gene_type:complete
MAVTRNIVFDGTIRTLKEKDGVLSDAADATALDTSGFSPQKRFRERILKKIDRVEFDKRIDGWRKQNLAAKQVYADVDYCEKFKTTNGSYPSRS